MIRLKPQIQSKPLPCLSTFCIYMKGNCEQSWGMVSLLRSNETLVGKKAPSSTAQLKRKEADTTNNFFPLSGLQVLHPLFYSSLHCFRLTPPPPLSPMDKHQLVSVQTSSIISFLGMMATGLCVAAEFKKSKKKDVKVNGKLCYLAEGGAFRLGIAALICLCVAHVLGNVVICRRICSGEKRSNGKAKTPWITGTLLILSWISFGFAVILVGTATSMNRQQPYREGWLDGKCFLVKDGVYISSAALVMVTIGSTISSIIMTRRKGQAEQDRRIHAQQHN